MKPIRQHRFVRWVMFLAGCLALAGTPAARASDSHDPLRPGNSRGDFGIFQRCYSGTELALPECTGAAGGLPASGTFVLHGRPVDVLPDGHTLLFVRSRFYDLKNGRWLQRDPKGNVDGPNLYEAFGSNAMAATDPFGTDIWVTARRVKSESQGQPAWAVRYTLHRNGFDLGAGDVWHGIGTFVWLFAPKGTEQTEDLGTEYYPFTGETDWRAIAKVDRFAENTRRIMDDMANAGADIAALSKAVKVTAFSGALVLSAGTATIVAPAAMTTFSTTTVGITQTTVLGNIAAASATSGAAGFTFGGSYVLLSGGTPAQASEAAVKGFAIAAPLGAPAGLLAPAGAFSAATADAQIMVSIPAQRGGRLVHLTDSTGAAGIDATGVLKGNIYAGPLSNASASGLGVTWRTGLMPGQYQAAVPIPQAAMGAFSRPVPVGVFTGWQRAMGTQYTAHGILDLRTGAFVRTGVNWTQVGWYGIDVGLDAISVGSAGYWLYSNNQTEEAGR